jgi:hypothetical protein
MELSVMFTKGQAVHFLQNWDSKGTVRVIDLVVHSCGKKQMILVDEAGVKFQGRNFHPTEQQGISRGRVVARLAKADAIAAALALGAEIVAQERARMERQIASYGYPEEHGYTKAMRQNLAALHEPRAIGAAVQIPSVEA